jgi:hypothetical protein
VAVSIIESCKGWDGGNYDENPKQCASNALSILIPYFYTREWWDQYIDTPEAYTQWRNNTGADYLDIQDARDLKALLLCRGAAASHGGLRTFLLPLKPQQFPAAAQLAEGQSAPELPTTAA